MHAPHPTSRRGFLSRAARLGGAAALPAFTATAGLGTAAAGLHPPRALALVHTHTHEAVDLVYGIGPRYLPEALDVLDHFLRDHHSGAVGRIDPGVYELLHGVRHLLGLGGGAPFEVISGYRAPATNARLRATRGGGVARHSLHMEGRAIDVRLPGVPLATLRDAARALAGGGVGYYPREQFVHLDTGRVRHW
ncbi:YcbK family protein [Rubrivivax sp. RP6-9]|uniref:YcbK family protein n=1 Tax=Rubrivivax sp. RP6-9 TaxID=3415750 RepID=UPI003CC54FBA